MAKKISIVIEVVKPYTIEFEKERIKTLEKYAEHIKHELYSLGVPCEVYYSDTPMMTIRCTTDVRKDTIADHIKASMYKLGVNVRVANPRGKEKGGKGKMGEEVVSDECLAALHAASDVIGEKCKFTPPSPAKTIEIEGAKIGVPTEEVEKLKGEYGKLTFEEKVAKEEESTWLRNMSTGWIRKVLPFLEPGTSDFEKARKAFAHSVAEGMVAKYAA